MLLLPMTTMSLNWQRQVKTRERKMLTAYRKTNRNVCSRVQVTSLPVVGKVENHRE